MEDAEKIEEPPLSEHSHILNKLEYDDQLEPLESIPHPPEILQHDSSDALQHQNHQHHDHHDLPEQFQMLPNTLILQQESIVLEKTCPENCGNENCILEDSAEKLEASVEESDLVLSLAQQNFAVRNITDEDEANEDRFIDAENYVLEESGQISVTTSQKTEKEESEPDLQAALFGTAVPRGEIIKSNYYLQ